jgi:CD63 antigen
MSDLSGCAKCVKYLLFVFNFLFLLAGLALIVIGAIVHVQTSKSGFSDSASAAGIFLIIIGCVVFVVSFFGCAGSINNNYCMVVTFGVLLLVILLAQIAAVITGFMMKDKLTAHLEEKMADSQTSYNYERDNVISKSWNETQEALKCCGTTGYASWNVSSVLNATHSVPDSCCKNFTDHCGDGKNSPQFATELYETGCYTAVKKVLDMYLLAVAIAAAVVGLLEIIGISSAFCLANALRKDYRVV